MWHSELFRLLGRSLFAMPARLSGSWFTVVYGLLSFSILPLRSLYVDGWDKMKGKWLETIKNAVLVSLICRAFLFMASMALEVFNNHNDETGRWRTVVNEKNKLKCLLNERDEYIKRLEAKTCPPPPRMERKSTIIVFPSTAAVQEQPLALTDLQNTVLLRDLKSGKGLNARIMTLGNSQDAIDFAANLQTVFHGWNIQSASVNQGHSGAPVLEFAIGNSQDKSVLIATRAFDHAKVVYTKNIDPTAYRGPLSLGIPPALTINIRDKQQ